MRLIKALRPVCIIVAVLIIAGCLSKAVYHPSVEIRYTPEHADLKYEEVFVETVDGITISAWWVPADRPRATVLFCHGNAGNMSGRLDTLIIFNRLNLNTCMFDYRGYGKSEGSPSEQGTYLDALAAYEFVRKKKNIPQKKIIIWGRSLGGPIAARTAADNPAGSLVIESTFISLKALVHDHYSWLPGFILSGYAYDTGKYLEELSIPVLVVHSRDDEMIPFYHGQELYKSIKAPKEFIEIKGSHNRGFIDSIDVYSATINDFINRCYMCGGEVSR